MTDKKENIALISATSKYSRVTSEAEILAVLQPITEAVRDTTPNFGLVTDSIDHAIADEDAKIAHQLEELSDKITVDSGHYLAPPKGETDAW